MSLTHALPAKNPTEWLVPPGSASRLEWGNSLRTSRLPSNGVAASSVSLMSSALATRWPLTRTGLFAGTGQDWQGALYHVLSQVRNGAFWTVASASRCQRAQVLGHRASVHTTPA